MVDFSNANLCGASPEMNDLFTKLEQAADEIEAKLEEAASAAASAFGSLEGELNALSDKLKSVEIPQLPKLNLQAEIKNLTSIPITAPEYATTLANIASEFGSSLTASGFSLDSLVSEATSLASSGGNLCSAVPNFEKVAGSTEDAVRKAEEVLQPTVAALTETASTVVQNTEVTEQVTTITNDVAATQAPLKTGGDEFLEDDGVYTVVEEKQVKQIQTDAGTTKVVTKKVEKVEEKKNVAPKSKSDGFVHRTETETLKVKADDGEVTTDNQGFTYFTVDLNHVPVNGTIVVTQLNLDPTQVTTFETNRKGADGEPLLGYKERYGVHGEDIVFETLERRGDYERAKGEFGKSASITTKGKELTIKTPYNISDDHPGNLESIEYRRLGRAGQKRPFFKCFMNKPKGGGRLRSDDRMNKRFKGFSFIISYDYRSNYDPEPST